MDPDIVVLGIGNTLMQDDGIGVCVVRELYDRYRLPSHVRLIEGGIAGIKLVEQIGDCERLIVVDAIKNGGPPGTIYRLGAGGLANGDRRTSTSTHDAAVVELLSALSLIGKSPQIRLVGVEPLEAQSIGWELTPLIHASLPLVVEAVIEELSECGVNVKSSEG